MKIPRFPRFRKYLQEFSDYDLGNSAAAMSYYMLFALIPMIVFIVGILFYFEKNFSFLTIQFSLKNFFPPAIQSYLSPIIKKVLNLNHNIFVYLIGAFSLLWASSSGFDYFWGKLQSIYDVPYTHWLLRRLLGILFVFTLTIMLLLLLITISFNHQVLLFLQYFFPEFSKNLPFHQFRYIVPFLFISFMLSSLYTLSSKAKYSFKYAFLSALLPAFVWLASSISLGWYVERFTRFDVIYGSLSGIIILCFWLYLLFYSAFIGAFLHKLSGKKKPLR